MLVKHHMRYVCIPQQRLQAGQAYRTASFNKAFHIGDYQGSEQIFQPPIDEPPIDEPPIDEPPIDEPPIDEIISPRLSKGLFATTLNLGRV